MSTSVFTRPPLTLSFFFFNDTATTEIYTLSLHDALPILRMLCGLLTPSSGIIRIAGHDLASEPRAAKALLGYLDEDRSEEHTSELQSPDHLVCRLLLEKKKK